MPRFAWLLFWLAAGSAAVGLPADLRAGQPVPPARAEYSAAPLFPQELLPLEPASLVSVPWSVVRPQPPAPSRQRPAGEIEEFSASPRRELPPLPPDEFALLPAPQPATAPGEFPFVEEQPPAVPEPLQEDAIPLLIPVPLPPEDDLLLERLSPVAPRPRPLPSPESPSPPDGSPDDLYHPGPAPTATPGLTFAPLPVWNPQHPALSQLPPTEAEFADLPGAVRPFPGPAELAAATAPATGWESLYQSTERRPLQTAWLGSGPLRVMVIASLQGNEPATGELLEAWVTDWTAANRVPAACTLLLVRNPNPDGQQRQQSANAAGVELNRNFPTCDFVADPAAGTGPYAGSEVETRTLLRLLAEFRPQRVICLRQATGRSRRLLANPSALSIAQSAIEGTPFQLDPLPRAAVPGSLESFVTRELQLELIIAGCPPQETPADFWRAQAAVFEKLATLTASDPPAPEQLPPAPAAPVAAPAMPRVSRLNP